VLAGIDPQAEAVEDPENWGATTQPFGVLLSNPCPQVVYLFYGSDPEPNSGNFTTLNSGASQHLLLMANQRIWLVDSAQNGLASVDIVLGTQGVTVTDDCLSLYTE